MLNTELDNLLKELKNNSQILLGGRKYWLIRTESGRFFETFLNNNFIALGHNNITNKDVERILRVNNSERDIRDSLKTLVEQKYKNEDRDNYGLIAGQIYRFSSEMSQNDVVLIPSENSQHLAIGRIEDNSLMPISTKEAVIDNCNYFKRRKVKWLKTLSKDEMDPLFFRVLQSHQAVNDISEYSLLIEKNIENYFIKDNIEYLVFNVKTQKNIKAKDLFELGTNILKISDDFFKKNNLNFDSDKFDVTISLNSPGKITFKSKAGYGLFFVALLIIGVNGGGLKINTENFNLDLSTDGAIQSVTEYLNESQDRELKEQLADKLDSLKIESPDDAIKLYKQFSANKDLPK